MDMKKKMASSKIRRESEEEEEGVMFGVKLLVELDQSSLIEKIDALPLQGEGEDNLRYDARFTGDYLQDKKSFKR